MSAIDKVVAILQELRSPRKSRTAAELYRSARTFGMSFRSFFAELRAANGTCIEQVTTGCAPRVGPGTRWRLTTMEPAE